ncbi:unnamed protein product [Allacma fusca]|uniref:Uncharacterized protein n=1 Tax=Allacma fusca TaxID=39272 RepID=A0A8J2LHW6_9HEXA|nr:unnamed protein product [Allacma fusca]
MQSLKNQRKGAKGLVTKLLNECNGKNPATITRTAYEVLMKKYDGHCEKIRANNDEILGLLVDDDDVDRQMQDQSDVEDNLALIENVLVTIGENLCVKEEAEAHQKKLEEIVAQNPTPTVPPSATTQPTAAHPKVKLPELKLPIFDGKLEQWLSFRDRFNQAVHNRTDFSASSLQNILSTVSNALSSISALSIATASSDFYTVSIVVNKLDAATKLRFHQGLPDKALPTWVTLKDFLAKEITDLASVKSPSTSQQQQSKGNYKVPTSRGKLICIFCSDEHANFSCPRFHSLSDAEKKKQVELKKLCENCLKSGHNSQQCKSPFTCREKECKQKHHTSLHSAYTKVDSNFKARMKNLSHKQSQVPHSLKPTAMVNAIDNMGNPVIARALLDNCSDAIFVESSFVSQLGLARRKLQEPVEIGGLEDVQVSMVTEAVDLNLTSRHYPGSHIQVEALVIDKIGGSIP